ncbi:hypothetical protein [Rhodopila sp.]|jgi:hypothetical protein|uniref:hypothetical protein n=1 Tax=Rhodopila sp. TaxID=2480087 RepID=UPI002BF7E5FC|nr:hypothetical protein [Rhodopila sp.]HVZ09926.1 hypothetical protein [Rhodopila sp.]
MSQDTADLLYPILLAGTVVGGLILLLVGFRLLLWPLRLIWRIGGTFRSRLGTISVLLCVIWTVAIVPAPFIFLWDWLLDLAQAVLVKTPQQMTVVLPSVLSTCSNGPGACASAILPMIGVVWSGAVTQPVTAMRVPPDLALAVLVFGIGITALVFYRRAQAESAFRLSMSGMLGGYLVLSASFLGALYLAITAILAIPVFNDTVPELGPMQTDLSTKMAERVEALDDRNILALVTERQTLPADLGPSDQSAGAPDRGINGLNALWGSQLDTWDQSAMVLRQRMESFAGEAKGFIPTAISFFLVSNQGHRGEVATKRHETVLLDSYGLWMADYRANIDRCTEALRDGLRQLRTVRSVLLEFIHVPSTSAVQVVDQLRKTDLSNYGRACTSIMPVVRDYLPARSGPAETLGLFGLASSWLLKTESPELALIVGLLGFGFFGALATSFIREFKGTPGNQLPGVGFILPALVRGIGAAVLVFLAAKGGAAVLAKGEVSPNAYAIFFACFVAAVFSDDVWDWARTKSVAAGERRQGAPDPAAK